MSLGYASHNLHPHVWHFWWHLPTSHITGALPSNPWESIHFGLGSKSAYLINCRVNEAAELPRMHFILSWSAHFQISHFWDSVLIRLDRCSWSVWGLKAVCGSCVVTSSLYIPVLTVCAVGGRLTAFKCYHISLITHHLSLSLLWLTTHTHDASRVISYLILSP